MTTPLMAEGPRLMKVFHFAECAFSTRTLTLSHRGEPLKLRPKTAELLFFLLEHRDIVLDKETLIREVWRGTAVTEDVVFQGIRELRAVLKPCFDASPIKTFPKRGYQWVVPATWVDDAEDPSRSAPTSADSVSSNSSISEPAVDSPDIPAEPAALPNQNAVARRIPRPLMAAVAVVAVLAVGALWFRGLERKPEPRTLAVLSFSNLDGRADADWLRVAIPEMLRAELSQPDHIRAVSGELAARGSREWMSEEQGAAPRQIRQVGRLTASDLVVGGSYLHQGDALRINADLYDPISGKALFTKSTTGDPDRFLDMIRELGAALAEDLGADPERGGPGDEPDSLPDTREAAEHYARGLDFLHRGMPRAAVATLEKAVSLAPRFPMAHARLAEALEVMGRDQAARDAANRAFLYLDDLNPEARQRVEGMLYTSLGDHDAAITTYQRLHERFPDDTELRHKLARALIRAGRPAEVAPFLTGTERDSATLMFADLLRAEAGWALSDFKAMKRFANHATVKAQLVDTRYYLGKGMLLRSIAARNLGELDEADTDAVGAEALFTELADEGGKALAILQRANVLLARRQYHEADPLYVAAAEMLDRIGYKRELGSAYNNRGNIAQKLRDLSAAKNHYQRALALYRETGQKKRQANVLTNLAALARVEGANETAHDRYDEAVYLYKLVNDMGGLANARANQGILWVRMGRFPQAREALEEAVTHAAASGKQDALGNYLSNLATICRMRNDLLASTSYLERAVETYADQGNSRALAKTLLRLGDLRNEMGALDGAQTAIDRALAIYRDEKIALGVALSHMRLAETALLRGDFTRCQTLVREVEASLAAEPEYKPGSIELQFLVTRLALAMGRDGLAPAQRAASLAAEQKKKAYVIQSLDALRAAYLRAERFGDAFAVQRRLVGLLRAEKDQFLELETELGRAELLYERGDHETALGLLTQNLLEANRAGRLPLAIELELVKGRIQAELGDRNEAEGAWRRALAKAEHAGLAGHAERARQALATLVD
ncbi:Winged helix-turn-helix domain-containing protein [Sulfidibacter corallicola]|uniref:Winged helix-turn-helix domain-containing protein n=1 Tax=Sulfidibacter corallicola TaxID=2818388 RepID=A0A8A4TS54_SULCO|nr:winged helix-turn-helix domain-containing protein [Sulfidibacter corallicola]QTD51868.1 winged helix-turn-helix domain-containing protein [Sulfidibacter corallicola]